MPKITANISGGTADFCTDIGTTPEGVTCHLPLNKIVWGDSTTSYKVNETYPLPVQVRGVTGDSLQFSGNIGASGNFPVVNPEITGVCSGIQFLAVAGTTTGDPVGVTGSVRLAESVGITGNVGVTGIVAIADSVTVKGEVGISGGSLNLNSGTDSVSVFGHDGTEFVKTELYATNGTTIGVSGDALKVAITNAGITFSATIASVVGITNANGAASASDAITVQGVSGGTPVIVKGRNSEAIEVTNTSGSALGITAENLRVSIEDYIKPSSMISGTLVAGHGSTGTQVLSASTPLKSGLTVKSHPSNIDFVFVGNSGLSAGNTFNGYPLESGESLFLEVDNANLVYVVGISGDKRRVNYIGS